MSRITDHGVAAVWGSAEATVFFIVPDVWTSWVALHRPRRGMATTVSALAGALAGGAGTYTYARTSTDEATRDILTAIPGISQSMVSQVERSLRHNGWRAFVLGPTTGVPYKIFVRTLGHTGAPLTEVLAWSVPARMMRFVAVTAGVGALGRLARRRGWSQGATRLVFASGWAAFYTWYFTAGPGRKDGVGLTGSATRRRSQIS